MVELAPVSRNNIKMNRFRMLRFRMSQWTFIWSDKRRGSSIFVKNVYAVLVAESSVAAR